MRDVAIYAPSAARIYAGAMGGGGAEVQTVLLAKALTVRGLDVAHVVYPVDAPVPLDPPSPTLVERRPTSEGRSLYRLRELFRIWSALSEADAANFVKRFCSLLEREGAALDLAGHRAAPPGLRVWCGCTVDAADVDALTPWLDWAFFTCLETLDIPR